MCTLDAQLASALNRPTFDEMGPTRHFRAPDDDESPRDGVDVWREESRLVFFGIYFLNNHQTGDVGERNFVKHLSVRHRNDATGRNGSRVALDDTGRPEFGR